MLGLYCSHHVASCCLCVFLFLAPLALPSAFFSPPLRPSSPPVFSPQWRLRWPIVTSTASRCSRVGSSKRTTSSKLSSRSSREGWDSTALNSISGSARPRSSRGRGASNHRTSSMQRFSLRAALNPQLSWRRPNFITPQIYELQFTESYTEILI